MKQLKKNVAYVLIALLVLNLVFYSMKKISGLLFWVILGIIASVSFIGFKKRK